MARKEAGATGDVAVVGAGAAGLMAAIAAGEAGARVILFNAHRRIGLKILMSGGTRCNITHDEVGPESYHGGSRNAIAIALKTFPAAATRAYFERLGVALKVEEDGRVFPASDSAKTVLDALRARSQAVGVELRAGVKVIRVRRGSARPQVSGASQVAPFVLDTSGGASRARALVLATGGCSYPQTGSDGTGYALARALGHTIMELTPALTPFVLAGDFHRRLQGVAVPATLTLWAGSRRKATSTGSLLFTHFGISGPAALDLSRHWMHLTAGASRRITASFLAGEGVREEDAVCLGDRRTLEAEWLAMASRGPRRTVQSLLARHLPVRLAREIVTWCGINHALALGQVPKASRDHLLEALVSFPLPVTGTLGYDRAEVTAGGVKLAEVDPRRMASRVCPGLFLAGEILDVDGDLGGYNFQWAWTSGRLAGISAAAWIRRDGAEWSGRDAGRDEGFPTRRRGP